MAPVRRIGRIHHRIRVLLYESNPEEVKFNDKVSKYVGGGRPAVDAFLVKMNRYKPFSRDKLALVPANVTDDDPKVHDLTSAAAVNYEKRGWTLTL